MCSHYISQKRTDKFKLVNSIINRKMVNLIQFLVSTKKVFTDQMYITQYPCDKFLL